MTGRFLAWALTTDRCGNWHPLTWLSHAIDFQLYGLRAPGHHLTSILLHLATSVLLLLLLNRLTGALWRSALAAALFALHPLRVESVVWIAERKDVLCAFFWMLTLWAYAGYAQGRKTGTSEFKAYYAAALLFFALGLMSKPMVVTLPFVMLLLDYWPLRRPWLIAEKIPFFALSAASCVVTYLVQSRSGAVSTLAALDFRRAWRMSPWPMCVIWARVSGRPGWWFSIPIKHGPGG